MNKLYFKFSLFSVFAAIFVLGCPNDKDTDDDGGGGGGGDAIGAYALLPSNINTGTVQTMYNSWIEKFYITYEEDEGQCYNNPNLTNVEARGTARIKASYNKNSTGCQTCSEAIGYGMILTSLMSDFEKFDRLLAYSKAFRISGTALMSWDITDFRDGSGGSATDADIDILASLFIAYLKTNEQKYLNDAIDIGASIYQDEVDNNTKLILPARSNETMGNGSLYNISYISLPAIKMLQIYDKSRDWATVLDRNLSYMEMVQNNGDGLWPDWSNASGVPVNPNNGSNDELTASDGTKVQSYEAYYKETPRIPWRIAWYYHWFGDNRAKAMLDKGYAFLESKGVSNTDDMKNFYSYTGGKHGSGAAGARDYSSLCALGMGSQQSFMNTCNEKVLAFYNPAVSSYYANSLQLIYAMLFNGKF